MGKVCRLRMNYYFCLSILSKSRTQYQTNFNKNLYYYLEQIFRLVKMFFRNHLLLCLATVAVSCRNKLFMQNIVRANKNLISGQWKLFSPIYLFIFIFIFFQALLPPKVTSTFSENIFFNESFIPATRNLSSVWWKQYASVRSLFSAAGNHD